MISKMGELNDDGVSENKRSRLKMWGTKPGFSPEAEVVYGLRMI